MVARAVVVAGLAAISVQAVMDPSDVVGDVEAFRARFVWVCVLGFLAFFLQAYGIGANDCANCFASSVGSKALTLKQACIIAAICEFLGVVLMGAQVTKTVRKGILDQDYLLHDPEVLMIGMMTALVGAGLWLLFCSSVGAPVSTTHSIIGSIIGVGMSINPAAVAWKTVGNVVLSWFVSPLLSGIFGALGFVFTRAVILRHPNAVARGYTFFPALLLFCFLIFCTYVVYKNSFSTGDFSLKSWRNSNHHFAILIAFGVACFLALITFLLTFRFIRRKVEEEVDDYDPTQRERRGKVVPWDLVDWQEGADEGKTPNKATPTKESGDAPETSGGGLAGKLFKFDADLHAEALAENQEAEFVHEFTEDFGAKREKLFSFLQIVSACFDSFAHGANDGANAVGPFAAVWAIYSEAKVSSKTDTITENMWIPVIGGAFISLGMATYGYKVIQSIGIKLTKITPSRGYCIEMGSSLTVIIFSNLGIPLSTTHCQVGATVGVGMCEASSCKEVRNGVNWKLMGKVFLAWIFTLVFAGLFSASLFTFISMPYFPRSASLPCGEAEATLSGIAGIHPNYTTPGGLTALFQRADANGDGKLAKDELEAFGMDTTVKGDDALSKWASGDEMLEEEFLKWRCGASMDTVDRYKCEPVCRFQSKYGDEGLAHSKEMKCTLSREIVNGFHVMATKYSAPTCE